MPFVKSISTRFLFLCFAISLACSVPVLWFAGHQAEQILLADFTGRLERRRTNLERHFREGGTALLTQKIRDRIARGLTDSGMILLVDAQGRRIEGNLSHWPAGLGDTEGWHPVRLRKGEESKVRSYLVAVTRLDNGHRLLVSGLLDDREEVRSAMGLALMGAFLLAMAVATVGSLVIRRHLDRMVQVVARTAANIADGNLQQRSPRNHSGDPLDCVAEALNRILVRIESLIEENRAITDALAHDLRSPLTRICASLELAGQMQDQGMQAACFIRINRDVALMIRMIDDTLEISRSEAGIGRENFEPLDLVEIMQDLFETYLPLAKMQKVRLMLDVDAELPILGNRGLLTRAIANLIDNAFKHGAGGREIALAASASGGKITISVSDRGQGIPGERHDEALARFRSLSAARSRSGSGLGLALVNAIAHLHNGRLDLDDNTPGLVARLTLP